MQWPFIIAQLKSCGLNQTQIAQLCDCSQPAISDLETGRTVNPNYALGAALLGLLAVLQLQENERWAHGALLCPPALEGATLPARPAKAVGSA